jgi:hypothetical protein
MQNFRLTWFVIWIASVMLAPLTGQAADTAAPAPVQNTSAIAEPEEGVEEIVIYGELDRFKLAEQVFRAEQDLYKLFSSLNDDEDYDIECKAEYPTGSRLHRINCRPNYINELMMEYGADPYNVPEGVQQYHKDELLRRMTKHLQEDQSLRTAALVHAKLKKRLDEVNAAYEEEPKDANAKK